jgi:hypothetical protein
MLAVQETLLNEYNDVDMQTVQQTLLDELKDVGELSEPEVLIVDDDASSPNAIEEDDAEQKGLPARSVNFEIFGDTLVVDVNTRSISDCDLSPKSRRPSIFRPKKRLTMQQRAKKGPISLERFGNIWAMQCALPDDTHPSPCIKIL